MSRNLLMFDHVRPIYMFEHYRPIPPPPPIILFDRFRPSLTKSTTPSSSPRTLFDHFQPNPLIDVRYRRQWIYNVFWRHLFITLNIHCIVDNSSIGEFGRNWSKTGRSKLERPGRKWSNVIFLGEGGDWGVWSRNCSNNILGEGKGWLIWSKMVEIVRAIF